MTDETREKDWQREVGELNKDFLENVGRNGQVVMGPTKEWPEDNVTKFEPVVVGENYRFDPDEILEAAKGQNFSKVAILAENPDGSIWISGSANAGETLVLMERAKHHIVFEC